MSTSSQSTQPEPLSPERLAEIREREAAATAGPWGTYHQNPQSDYCRLIDIAADLQETGSGYRCRRYIGQLESGQIDNDPAHREWGAEQDNEQSAADAEFIAHARSDVPALLAEIDRMRKQNAELDKACDEVMQQRDHLHDIADKLAYAVAPIETIGEHSSGNDPWENALDHITPVAEVDRLRAELAARPTRAAVLREAKAEVVSWLAKKAREDTPVWRLADKVERGAVRIFLEADTAEAAEQWAERDRRVAKLNARVEAHNQGEHAFCGDECDEIWHQGGAR